jgi:putative oxidoreductase
MRRIDIDEADPPVMTTVGQTLLRVVIGALVVAHGADKLLHLAGFQAELAQLALPNPEIIAPTVAGVEIAAGLALVVGRLTRFASFLVLCDALAMAAVLVIQHRFQEQRVALEILTLLAAVAFYFLSAGSGVFSADSALRKRARLKALREDEIWQRPPYVAPPEGVGQEAPLAYEAAGPSYEAAQPDAEAERRRRILARHNGSRY